MTLGEALLHVDHLARKTVFFYKIEDRLGEILDEDDAILLLMRWSCPRWENNDEALVEGRITPEKYVQNAKDILSEFGRYRRRCQVEAKIKELTPYAP